MLAQLQFLRPIWFAALIPLAVLVFVLWRRQVQDQGWRGLVDAHLLPHLLVGADGAPRRFPIALLGLGWLIAVLALAGPVWERLPQPVFSTTSSRVILLDLSPSMNATDVTPSRLARARFELLDILRASDEGQVALIAFGPEPFLVSPLTGDAQTIAAQVPRLASDLIPVPGPRRTDRALAMAGDLLEQVGATGGEVILITDGVGDGSAAAAGVGSGGDSLAAATARKLAASGIRVSVLGVGTEDGAPVPTADGGFANDRSGAIHMARLDRDALRTLARAGGGESVPLVAGDGDTAALVASPNRMTTEAVEQEGLAADQWREEGPWLLLALLPVAALGFRRGWLLPALLVAVLLPSPEPLLAQEGGETSAPDGGWQSGLARVWSDLWQRPDQRAARAFESGDDGAAASGFDDPAWRAAARYRAGDHDGALDDLSGLSGSEADYNRGNALARLNRLDEAIAAYERTLEQVPGHDDAQANLDLVRRLKEQQQAQQPQDPRESGKSDSDSGSDNQQRQSQGEGEPQDGDQSQGGQDPSQGADDQSQAGQDGSPQSPEEGSGSESEGTGEDPSEQDPGQGSEQAQGQGQDQGQAGQPPDSPDGDQASAEGSGGDANQSADPGAQAGPQGPGQEPDAGDLGEDAISGQPQADLAADQETPDGARPESSPPSGQAQAREPEPPDGEGPAVGAASEASLTPEQREQAQAMEAQLRRVPDDPAGLLRQRFLLQHLRREGRLQ